MNSNQKRVLGSWRQILWQFTKREYLAFFTASAIGMAAAEVIHLVGKDQAFQSFLFARYKPAVSFDDPSYYTPYLIIIVAILVLAIGPGLVNYVRRGLRSCLTGVTSGLILLPLASALYFALVPSAHLSRVSLACAFGGIWFVGSFALHLRAKVHAERRIKDTEIKVPSGKRSQVGTQLVESDEPIELWEQDALGRAALVDSLSTKIMVGKAPVIALSGAFGAGKTSILNLLREHLDDKAITVSFSTWLPGSQETLTSYLLADITSECKKKYIVPGLRQSAHRFATALGQKVPFLSDYLKLLPATTQKDDIENLKRALIRLPKRVVVLLDEIDRMEKGELLTLLKVIRGISTLPNLSFVCAGDLEVMLKTIKEEVNPETLTYFQKFFPVVISVPEPNPEALRKFGIDRLLKVFVSLDWFEDESSQSEFIDDLGRVWNERIAPFCRNMRTIGLLANDLSIAAAPLRREVDSLDLVLIELLHRFRPAVYDLISKNSLTLTGGEGLARGGPFQTDEEVQENQAQLLKSLKEVVSNDQDLETVQGILCELFPSILKNDPRLRRPRPKRQTPEQKSDKIIREATIFPAYFRYELPEGIFSYVEMAALLRRLEKSTKQADREEAFLQTLDSMPKGSLKRDDFLRKLADQSKSIPEATAKELGLVAVKAASKYTYDLMPGFGEAGHVLRMVLWTARRLSHPERLAFLRECILNATDDTMAFNILRILTNQKDDLDLKVTAADLYNSFAERMRKRYGLDVDVTDIDLSTSDPWAFDYWGSDLTSHGFPTDPEDRKIQNEFWLRYIGNSRARLAEAFRGFFFPVAAYSGDPANVVKHKIDLKDLQRLYEELPETADLTDRDRKSLDLLRRLLGGEFKNGVNPMSRVWD